MKQLYIFAVISALLFAFCIDVKAQTSFSPVRDISVFSNGLSSMTSSLSSIDCSFKQTQQISALSRKVVSEGRFYYEKSDRICFDYSKPYAYRLSLNGDKMKTVTQGKSSVITLKGNPMMSQMQSLIAACMTGDLSLLSGSCKTSYLESGDCYLAKVTPTVASVKAYIIEMEIYFDKKDFSVVRLVMRQNARDFTQYDFSDKKLNVKINEEVFSVR